MTISATPFDTEIERIAAEAQASKARAEELAKQAKAAARIARKAAKNAETLDRRTRDRARYVAGGAVLDRLPALQGWLLEHLTEADFDFVCEVGGLDPALVRREEAEKAEQEKRQSDQTREVSTQRFTLNADGSM